MAADEVISLLSDSGDDSEHKDKVTTLSEHTPTRAEAGMNLIMSPSYRSCSLRAFNYMMSLDLDHFISTFLTTSESTLLYLIRNVVTTFPRAAKHLAVLLARKWPKWHVLRLDHPDELLAIEALVSIGCISTCESVLDWSLPSLLSKPHTEYPLMRNLSEDSNPKPLIDLLLHSISPKLLGQLLGSPNQQLSRSAAITKLKAAYDGKQRTIFGDRNDIPKLVKTISSKLESEEHIALILSPAARELFTILSFVLDIDSEEDDAWNMALPGTLLKTFANVSGRRSPKLFLGSSWSFDQVPVDSRIYTSRKDVDMHRIVYYLEESVMSRKIDPVIVAENARNTIAEMKFCDDDFEKPEWWRRRKLPRRLSNLIWKCNAEIERLKKYELSTSHLRFLLDNHVHLLGKKRLGKVLIRFMICSGHVSEDPGKVRSVVSKFLLEPNLLYPADVAELTRRLAGLSITKFEWPCGEICERQIIIPGAKSRDVNWVEQAAIEFYYVTNEGGYENGVHCEGRVMMEIFSALFNQSVLAPDSVSIESGLLQSPLQKWALDIGFLEQCSKERWDKAMEIIDRFSTLDYEALVDFYSTLNVENEEDSNQQLPVMEILRCMRGSILAAIMRLMIADPYYWGGGQPDLIVWNSSKREICFAEVKGPGDQLSPRQRWWLAHLREAGATAEVCWVIDEPKKNSRRKEDKTEEVISKKRRKKKLEFPKDPESAGTSSSANTSSVEIIELLISTQE